MKKVTKAQFFDWLKTFPKETKFVLKVEQRERGWIDRYYIEGELVAVVDVAITFPRVQAFIKEAPVGK